MGTLLRTCATVPQSSELRFTVVRSVIRRPRHCCIRWGSTSCKGKGHFGGVFVLHFHNGRCHWAADGEMFPIRMHKLDNISVRQTYRWKAGFVGFLVI